MLARNMAMMDRESSQSAFSNTCVRHSSHSSEENQDVCISRWRKKKMSETSCASEDWVAITCLRVASSCGWRASEGERDEAEAEALCRSCSHFKLKRHARIVALEEMMWMKLVRRRSIESESSDTLFRHFTQHTEHQLFDISIVASLPLASPPPPMPAPSALPWIGVAFAYMRRACVR